MRRRRSIDRPWLRALSAALLPLLLFTSLSIELGHDHGALLETSSDGSWEQTCIDGHSKDRRQRRDGVESAGMPHRHTCEACHLGSQTRAHRTAQSRVPTALAAGRTALELEPPHLGRTRLPLPPLRGPPIA